MYIYCPNGDEPTARESVNEQDPLMVGDRPIATAQKNQCNPIAKGKRKNKIFVKMCWAIIVFSVFVSLVGVGNFVKLIIDKQNINTGAK